MTDIADWEELKSKSSACTSCALNQLPYKPGRAAFGIGDLAPKIVFVGEAPGEQESIRGVPFVGPAGKLLQQTLQGRNYKMSDIYVLNAVKHRPPGNRNPLEEEIRTCGQLFLIPQIKALAPKYLVALGKVGAQALAMVSEEPVVLPSKGLRGRQFPIVLGGKTYPVFCTWHPAYCLRNTSAIPQLQADLQSVLHKVQELETLLGETDGNS